MYVMSDVYDLLDLIETPAWLPIPPAGVEDDFDDLPTLEDAAYLTISRRPVSLTWENLL
jgi:hypothetical protein